MRVTLRMGKEQYQRLADLLFCRYPSKEWATFGFSGWSEHQDSLLLTLAELSPPVPGELNDSVPHVEFREPYSLKHALASEGTPLAVTVIHSHPKNYIATPSHIDDDMDAYYATYFGDFAPGRPYVSFIVSLHNGEPQMGGRVHWSGEWYAIDRFIVEGVPVETVKPGGEISRLTSGKAKVQRLIDAFGDEAADRLRQSTVAIIGVGGTGSGVAEVLARAGVGNLILVDPDTFDDSNLERVHGSELCDIGTGVSKVLLAERHIRAIDPSIRVMPIDGRLPQSLVTEKVIHADVILGCTDSHATRLALSDIAWRYAVPVLDIGVSLEGANGMVTGQPLQVVYFGPGKPCAICQRMYDPERVTYELMSDADKLARRAAAARAEEEGRDPNAYWRDYPQLNTVGYLTTMAGALVAGYAIGLITGRFCPPFVRLQADLSAPLLGTIDEFFDQGIDCVCRSKVGWADQGAGFASISAPAHWSAPRILA